MSPYTFPHIHIICANEVWREILSTLIDMDDYFEDHFYWERRLSSELTKVVKSFGKDFSYDLEGEHITVEFTQVDVDWILKDFDSDVILEMKHFTALLLNYIYSREFSEAFTDYSARSTAMMHKLREEMLMG